MSFIKQIALNIWNYILLLINTEKLKHSGKRLVSLNELREKGPFIYKTQLDAVLVKESRNVDKWLEDFTLPLIYLNEKKQIRGCGSGVLLRLGERYFILTAGHCVSLSIGKKVALAIEKAGKFFIPTFANKNYIDKKDYKNDFGYFELAPVDARYFETKRMVFMSSNRLKISSMQELKKLDDWVVVSGFPDKNQERDKERQYVSLQQLHVSTVLAGTGRAPVSHFLPLGKNVIELWISESGCVESTAPGYPEVPVPNLGGASGGGCWKSNVRPLHDNWTPNEMKLIGIHIATESKVKIHGEFHYYYRSSSITCHLLLLSQDYPDLHDMIFDIWPVLSQKNFIY